MEKLLVAKAFVASIGLCPRRLPGSGRHAGRLLRVFERPAVSSPAYDDGAHLRLSTSGRVRCGADRSAMLHHCRQ
jgi:hypothetical protein